MKKMLLALVMVVLLSGTAWAVEGRVTPAIPFDYNGNPAPVIRDSGNGWLLDSGVVTIADTVAVHIDDTSVVVSSGDSALLVVLDTTITISSGDSALLISGRLDSITDTVTVATAPYNGNAGGTAVFSESVVVPVAIDLGGEYYLWEITSDTDCVISPDSATLTPLNGDIVRQYDPFVYPGRLQTIYAVTRTGLIDSAAVIRARGWR